ncbi:unnamed protein product [Parnassius apollo]|uniref:(apollo) hypothetical protein n=1 Tax=Parnassius apollo TaxID=110799 RepID=A0A8S3X4T9_PARAO|nr:unnamed protein product [Parnassius apollo]
MNLDKNECKKLPDGWVLCKSKSNPGRKYYFNRKNGKSSWTKPEVADKPCSSLKRKSDGNDGGSSREKCRKETQKKDLFPNRKATPNKNINTKDVGAKKSTSPKKPTPSKNLANKRLSQLRDQLTAEAEKDKDVIKETSPRKRVRESPKSNVNETPVKIQRTELKSPSLNDSKCTITSQSPSNDSLQSTPSPSQFFAANKIIYSMKAQLPEEFNNKEKQKDTFADIEQGICNQTPEYPFNKHPATPPQFSEASKLVSAIKSKLTYKLTIPEEGSVKKYTTAKDRMEALRTSLTTEETATSTKECSINDSVATDKCLEAMDVEDVKETVPNLSQKQTSASNNNTVQEKIVLVVDTNIFIHELDFIKNVLNSHIKGYSEQPTLLVPWRVINELDRLKDNNNGNGALCKRAKSAMDYLYKSLPENNRIKGQSLRDANSHIYPCEVPDDEILNCCLQQAERGKPVILLSNDKNLCNKASINNIKRIGLDELRPLLESKPQPVVDPGLYASVKHYEHTMYQLLANILENEMRAKYNTLWQHVVFKAPPWSLCDVLQCLLKHWIAVFHEVFPRIEHVLTDLKNSLTFIQNKDPQALSQSEVSNFKELCMDIAKKCQIIPEYMELAKSTVERLVNTSASETHCGSESKTIVDAFESVWTVFSSYCAKLSTCLGVPHSLEDHLAGNDTLEMLTSKWAMFRNQLNTLSHAIKGVLSMENSDLIMEDHIARLETALKDCLVLISMDSSVIGRDDLRIFCVRNRDMLQEAFAKLSQLTNMLDVCKNYLNN